MDSSNGSHPESGAGQIVPEAVPVFTSPDGSGTAFVAGRRVIVGPNSNRVLRIVQ
jgi:hypothetical protein